VNTTAAGIKMEWVLLGNLTRTSFIQSRERQSFDCEYEHIFYCNELVLDSYILPWWYPT